MQHAAAHSASLPHCVSDECGRRVSVALHILPAAKNARHVCRNDSQHTDWHDAPTHVFFAAAAFSREPFAHWYVAHVVAFRSARLQRPRARARVSRAPVRRARARDRAPEQHVFSHSYAEAHGVVGRTSAATSGARQLVLRFQYVPHETPGVGAARSSARTISTGAPQM